MPRSVCVRRGVGGQLGARFRGLLQLHHLVWTEHRGCPEPHHAGLRLAPPVSPNRGQFWYVTTLWRVVCVCVCVRWCMCACVRVDLTIPALVGIKKLPQKDDYNEFDITSLVGGLFFALILHQLLPVFLSVLHFSSLKSSPCTIPHSHKAHIRLFCRAWPTRRKTESGR